MSAVWDALAIFLTLTFAVGFIAADFYLQRRRPRNSWKKRPIPSERPAPHVGTFATSQLLRDVDLTQTFRMHSPRQPLEAATETTENAA